MMIFDNLTPCMVACLGLTCREFYASCKVHHPKPFSLALHVTQVYYPNPNKPGKKFDKFDSCAHNSYRVIHGLSEKTGFNSGWKSRRKGNRYMADTWRPSQKFYLADLIETWSGFRDHQKVWSMGRSRLRYQMKTFRFCRNLNRTANRATEAQLTELVL